MGGWVRPCVRACVHQYNNAMILCCFLGYMSEEFCMSLAEDFGNEYLRLGIHLGLSEAAIKTKHADDNGSVLTCIFHILTTWKRGKFNPDSMTAFKELCDAFNKMGRADLVRRITIGE